MTFIDSYKYYPQKLESLPKRFQLEDVKGYFPHVFNKPEHWGRILKNPPPLSAYISNRDGEKARSEKTSWWEGIKRHCPEYNFNDDCVKYCQQDVKVLMAASTKFLQQCFDFGQQMIERFGVSKAFKNGLCQPHFHPFSNGNPTLGSYSYVFHLSNLYTP